MIQNLILVILIIFLLCSACETQSTEITVKPVKQEIEIFYYFDDSIQDHQTIMMNIKTVLVDVTYNVGINFYETDELTKGVVEFKYIKDKNHATVGKCDYPIVVISSGRLRIAYHEIFHMLGMQHTHQRYDRYDYITVNYDNIPSDVVFAFDIIDADNFLYNVDDYDYDYDSIMHYSSKTFGDIIKHIDGSLISSAELPSEMDWQKLNDIYN